jgi:hypothetical protein
LEAAGSLKILAPIYQTTQHHIPKDRNPLLFRCSSTEHKFLIGSSKIKLPTTEIVGLFKNILLLAVAWKNVYIPASKVLCSHPRR